MDNKTSVRFCKVGPVPKVTQEHLDARRAEILEGARRAFARYGYDGATVARLEEATGLSRGAIFHYFDGKKDLFAEVAADVNRRYVGVITAGGLTGVGGSMFADLDPLEQPLVMRRKTPDMTVTASRPAPKRAFSFEIDFFEFFFAGSWLLPK